VTAGISLEARIVQSFERLVRPSASPLVQVLRKRLVGELFGDAEVVAATFDPAFTVVMHSGETPLTLPGDAIAKGVQAQAATGVLMWTELDDLIIERETIAASGEMLNLHLSQRTLTTTPIGLFLRFKSQRMISEVAFMGAPISIDVSAEPMPIVDGLRAQLDS
jgi:hypothetical protein